MAYLETHHRSKGRDVRWRVIWRDENGKKKRKYLPKGTTRAKAEEIKGALTKKENGKVDTSVFATIPNRGIAPTFADYIRNDYLPWFKVNIPRSIERTEHALVPLVAWFGHLTLEDGEESRKRWTKRLTAYETKRLGGLKIGSREWKPLKASTLKREWGVLKTALRRSVTLFAIMNKSPLAERKWETVIPKKTSYPFFELDDLEAIYEADPENAATWRFMASTGLRRSEAMKALKSEVSDDEIRVTSFDADGKLTKTDSSIRTIPLCAAAKESLEEILSKNPNGPYLFPKKHERTWSKDFKKAVEAADLEGHLHMTRHSFITHAINTWGVALPVVSGWAGHTNLETTKLYAHTSADHEKYAVAKLAF